ncbi:MAG: hypothetical protein ACREOZ_02150 [Gloeomargaritales cyanobacterium]
MLSLVDKTFKVQSPDVTAIAPCSNDVYAAWIARVQKNNTPVKDGDTYVWLYVQLLPPRIVNCIITVRVGDGTVK